MFIDEAEIVVKGGKGGAGKVSFHKPPQVGPDGGNGGNGGSVYIKVTSDLTALRPYTSKRAITAGNGENGGSNRMFGGNGKDIEILMPTGTILTDLDSNEQIELSEVDQRILIAKGGMGGKGNYEFRSSTNTTPEFAQPGLEGHEKHLQVSLKLIADFGLIGLPNAGKSSLLNELTNAQAKVANYPFTTLEPNLGVINLLASVIPAKAGIQKAEKTWIPDQVRDDNDEKSTNKIATPTARNDGYVVSRIIADIPGIIEGAALGKGLGVKFLKHVEKTKVLIHCITAESENPKKDYQTIRNELKKYSPELIDKKEIIILTKSDMVEKKELEKKIKILKKLNPNVYVTSIHDMDSLETLKITLAGI